MGNVLRRLGQLKVQAEEALAQGQDGLEHIVHKSKVAIEKAGGARGIASTAGEYLGTAVGVVGKAGSGVIEQVTKEYPIADPGKPSKIRELYDQGKVDPTLTAAKGKDLGGRLYDTATELLTRGKKAVGDVYVATAQGLRNAKSSIDDYAVKPKDREVVVGNKTYTIGSVESKTQIAAVKGYLETSYVSISPNMPGKFAVLEYIAGHGITTLPTLAATVAADTTASSYVVSYAKRAAALAIQSRTK